MKEEVSDYAVSAGKMGERGRVSAPREGHNRVRAAIACVYFTRGADATPLAGYTIGMDRVWFLTSTFYGNWLPGDPRGFVSRVRDARPDEPPRPTRREHDRPGTPYDENLEGLHQHATEQLRGPPVQIGAEHAAVLLEQFRETARYRGWRLVAAAIMSNHVHLVVGVTDDPNPEKILGDFKAYGSRALNRRWGKPASETWWTSRGSTRKLSDEAALRAVIDYVREQPNALLIWIDPDYQT